MIKLNTEHAWADALCVIAFFVFTHIAYPIRKRDAMASFFSFSVNYIQ